MFGSKGLRGWLLHWPWRGQQGNLVSVAAVDASAQAAATNIDRVSGRFTLPVCFSLAHHRRTRKRIHLVVLNCLARRAIWRRGPRVSSTGQRFLNEFA